MNSYKKNKERIQNLYNKGRTIEDISIIMNMSETNIRHYILCIDKRFNSFYELRNYQAKEKGFDSHLEYLNHKAKEKGFDSHLEYEEFLADKRKKKKSVKELREFVAKEMKKLEENRLKAIPQRLEAKVL